MKKKGKKKSERKGPGTSPGGPSQGKFLRQCGRVLLLSASYQICSLWNPGIQDLPREPGENPLLDTFSSQGSPFLTHPAEAGNIPGKCVGGCIACTGCTGCTGCTRSTGGNYAPAYDPVAEAHRRAHVLNEEGVRYNKNGKFAKGLECFREAARLWPEDAVIQRNLRKTEQALLNEQGVKYYQSKDWAKAVEYFQQALNKWPENEAVRNNLKNAREALQAEAFRKEQQRQEDQAAVSMRKIITDMGSAFNSPAPGGSGLDFGRKTSSPSSGGLEFMPATPPSAPPQDPVGGSAGDPRNKKPQFNGTNQALEEARSNRDNTQQGKPGAVFDYKGKAAPAVAAPEAGAIQMSERARKDPRMIEAQKKLTDLQDRRQKLEEKRTQLAKERNLTLDPDKSRKLTQELDKAEKAYQENLLAVANQSQAVEKLKRTIDTEVEGSDGQTNKGGGK